MRIYWQFICINYPKINISILGNNAVYRLQIDFVSCLSFPFSLTVSASRNLFGQVVAIDVLSGGDVIVFYQ